MSEWNDWSTDDIMALYKIVQHAEKAKKKKKLSQILDSISDLREYLGKLTDEKISTLLGKLLDVLVLRNQENT